MTTALIWDNRFRSDHDIGYQELAFPETSIQSDVEFENPRRMGLIYDMLQQTKVIKSMDEYAPVEANMEDLTRVHSEHMVHKVIEASNTTQLTEVGSASIAAKGSYETAKLATGGAMKAVDILFSDTQHEQAYACVRPPGHHATKTQSMGFCLFNNVAIAAEYSRKKYGVDKILIVDWDVHHGNGTQDIFYDDSQTYFISIHQNYNFPTSGGTVSESGTEDAPKCNMNIPLPPGCGDEEYMAILEDIVEPVAEFFQPELILVSAGQDPSLYDPLGRMMVTRAGFKRMTQTIRQIANKVGCEKLAVIQEGGYSLAYLPIATLGVMEGLLEQTVPQTFAIEEDHPFANHSVLMETLIENIKLNFPAIF